MLRGAIVLCAALACAHAWAEPYNLTLALAMNRLSAAAYCSNSSIIAWNCVPCTNPLISSFKFDAMVFFPKTQTRGFLGFLPFENQIVISFEGSEVLQNFITDLTADLIPLPVPGADSSVQVHKGFYDAYMDVRDEVMAALNSLLARYPSASIVITGHSLGAALATVCAIELVSNYHYKVTVYDYGRPRVGNQAFAAFFNQSVYISYRTVHYHDLVPHLPLEDMGYYHTPTEAWLFTEDFDGTMSSVKVCDYSGEDPTCSDSVPTIELTVSDHLDYFGMPIGEAGCQST